MMMECPRCGFTQPKDQYCASCGLDVEHYVAKPKPFWLRTLQNPNFHLSLIAVLIAVVTGYILYSQSARLGRQVESLLTGRPLSSREAGDPTNPSEPAAKTPEASPPSATPPTTEAVTPVAAAINDQDAAQSTEASVAAPENQRVEVTSWEIPHEALGTFIGGAEKVGESTEGRAYLWNSSAAKLNESLQSTGRRIAMARSMPAQNGAQLAIETPPSSSEGLQFGIYFQASRESKDLKLKWDSTLVQAPAENGTEATGQAPVVKALTETNLNGTAGLASGSLLLIVLEPSNRAPRADYVNRAGDGPWSIFSSDDFRSGTTDWVMVVQLK